MTDVTVYGDQQQRPPDEQPERVVMRAPDGRTVQVMTDDVADFEGRGFVLASAPFAEPAATKAKRTKPAPAKPEEAS